MVEEARCLAPSKYHRLEPAHVDALVPVALACLPLPRLLCEHYCRNTSGSHANLVRCYIPHEMNAIAHAPNEDDRPREDQSVILVGTTWADYQRLLEVRGESAAPRITYLEGRLEIMSPSRMHDFIKSILGCLVEVYCLENDIEFSTYGSWTLEDKASDRGAEPDECYVFGRVANPERPHLAIEVVWSSGGLNKLDVYRKLGVQEVWYWRRGAIVAYVLEGETFREQIPSKALPGIDLAELASFVDRPTTSAAIREYREALRSKKR